MLTLPDFNEKRIVVVLNKNGEKISFKNDNLIVTDNNNKIKCQYTCYKIFLVLIVGGVNITTGIIERAKRFGFSIVLMSYNFKVYETLNFRLEGNTLLREKQYRNQNDLNMASKIIINKISNQKNILIKLRNNEVVSTIKVLKEYVEKIQNNELEILELMGIEGIAAKIYFKELYKEFNWQGRQPRVKRDEINLLLDIGYTLLFNYIEAIVHIYGFDIYKGVLHKEFYKRKSLICDLIEPFRPIIDYKIRKMYNLAQINKNDFIIDNGRYSLSWEKNSKYITCFLEEIIKYKRNIFEFVQSYYRWFMKDKQIEAFPFVELEEK